MATEVERRLGPVDVLVNSAGAAKRYLPEELNEESWHAAMDAKYFTYIHAMDAVLPADGRSEAGESSLTLSVWAVKWPRRSICPAARRTRR